MSKRTGCVKTGAMVHFSDHNLTISADVYRIGTCILIRTNNGQLSYDHGRGNSRIDLTIRSNGGCEEFWREDLGVFAVPEDQINFHIEI
jgi:hypothetical protein